MKLIFQLISYFFNSEQGKLYYGQIDLGKKNVQKNFKVIFDTGSSTTWLFGENCEKCLT